MLRPTTVDCDNRKTGVLRKIDGSKYEFKSFVVSNQYRRGRSRGQHVYISANYVLFIL